MFRTKARESDVATPGVARARAIKGHFQEPWALWRVAVPASIATAAAWLCIFVVWTPFLSRFAWSGSTRASGNLFWDACLRVVATTVVFGGIFTFVALAARRKSEAVEEKGDPGDARAEETFSPDDFEGKRRNLSTRFQKLRAS